MTLFAENVPPSKAGLATWDAASICSGVAEQEGVERTSVKFTSCADYPTTEACGGESLSVATAGSSSLHWRWPANQKLLASGRAGRRECRLRKHYETMNVVDPFNQRLGITVLFTEHDMSVVSNHARRLYRAAPWQDCCPRSSGRTYS